MIAFNNSVFFKLGNDRKGKNVMKKAIPVTFILIAMFLLVSLCGCSANSVTPSQTNMENTYYEDGSYSYQTPSGISYNIKTLPFTLQNNDLQMDLVDAQYYEVYSEANHGYTGYAIAVFDRSNLTDDDIYWMDKMEYATREFDVNAFIRKKDSSDSSFMVSFWNKYDQNYWYRIFRTSETMRYSLGGGQISIQSVWDANNDDAQDMWYHYIIEIDEETDYSDLSRLTTNEVEMITKAMLDAIS